MKLRVMGEKEAGVGVKKKKKKNLVHNSFRLIMASLARRAAGILQATQGNLIPGNPKKPAGDTALSPGKPHYTILQYVW